VFLQGFPTNLFISDASVGLGFQRLDRIQINTIQPPRAFNSETQLWQSTVPLTITVSASGGIAEGTVIDGARLSAGAEVILVPALETARLRKDRYFMARSDESGRFRVDGIPPGPYAAFAFQKLEPILTSIRRSSDRYCFVAPT
jgi:hypothetical protein